MPNIVYQNYGDHLVAKWPGKSIRQKDGRITKTGQIHLGKVISKEKQIFWTRGRGYYHFNVETLAFESVDLKDLSNSSAKIELDQKQLPAIVDFGDSYFLDHLIKGIKYDQIIASIGSINLDSLYALIFYYVLDGGAVDELNIWFNQNYVSYLFPKANVESSRIIEQLAKLGEPEVKRRFLKEHIKYVLNNIAQDLCIFVLSNSYSLSTTSLGDDLNNEFKIITVVQKSTGIPIYYEYTEGSVVDLSTVNRIREMLEELGYKVDSCAVDLAYPSPESVENLVLSGSDFISLLNSSNDLYKRVVNEHYEEFLIAPNNFVTFGDREFKIVKFKSVVVQDPKTNDALYGYIYLCCDLMVAKDYINEEFVLHGLFAIISNKDLPNEQILPEYHKRVAIGKNFHTNFLSFSNDHIKAFEGHLLLSFIASFFFTLIKNRLAIMDEKYIEIPFLHNAINDLDTLKIEIGQEEKKILEQQPYESVARASPKTLFREARGCKANILQTNISPSVPTTQFKNFCGSFGIDLPMKLLRIDLDHKLIAYDHNNKQLVDDVDLRKIFAIKSSLTESEFKRLKEQKEQKELKEEQNCKELSPQESKEKNARKFKKSKALQNPKVPMKRGRPFGSKNKKTLEREERIRNGLEQPKPKGKKGRPLGAKNKRTLERERKIALGEIVISPKVLKKRGRPLGKKDSKPRVAKQSKS